MHVGCLSCKFGCIFCVNKYRRYDFLGRDPIQLHLILPPPSTKIFAAGGHYENRHTTSFRNWVGVNTSTVQIFFQMDDLMCFVKGQRWRWNTPAIGTRLADRLFVSKIRLVFRVRTECINQKVGDPPANGCPKSTPTVPSVPLPWLFWKEITTSRASARWVADQMFGLMLMYFLKISLVAKHRFDAA